MTRLTQHEYACFRNGDEAVFRHLVEEHSPRLLAFVRPFAGDLDEAYDLLQETWRRVYEKRATFSGVGSLLGWLYAVCRSVCLSAVELQSSRSRFTPDPTSHMGAAPPAPDRAAEHAELRRSVNRALLELPDRERDVVILRMIEQHSTRETADVLGCAEGTVKASLHRALKKLQTAMEAWVR